MAHKNWKIMLINVFLYTTITMTVQCQSSVQTPYNNNMYDGGKIFFGDRKPSVEIQKSISQELPVKITTENRETFSTNPSPIRQSPGHEDQFFASNVHVEKVDNTRQRAQIPNRIPSGNISTTVTNFGVNFLKVVSQLKPGNIVVSPYSVVSLLSLLQQGAVGTTQLQISESLNMSPEQTSAAFAILNREMQKRNSQNVVKVANNIFLASAFNLNRDFKRVAVQNFASDLTPLSFAKSVEAAQLINNWVASKTFNKIQDILPLDSLSEDNQAVLVNAVYFKGLWQMKFKVDSTQQKDFYLSDGSKKVTPFMHLRKYYRSGYDVNIKSLFVIVPFERNEYSLVMILPSSETNVATTLLSLTGAQITDYHNASPKEVDLIIPKFTARCDTDLDSALRIMGISSIFNTQTELSGIGSFRNISPQISSARHSAMLSIDENGATAAAATAFAVVALSNDSPAFVFNANKPFIAIVWDNELAMPLFMARIEDPTV